MGHITRTDTHLPPRLYTADIALGEGGLHVEFAAGLHIAALHLSGDTSGILADLDTIQTALKEARLRLEERVRFAEYDAPAPRGEVAA